MVNRSFQEHAQFASSFATDSKNILAYNLPIILLLIGFLVSFTIFFYPLVLALINQKATFNFENGLLVLGDSLASYDSSFRIFLLIGYALFLALIWILHLTFIQMAYQKARGKKTTKYECFKLAKNKFVQSIGLIIAWVGIVLGIFLASILISLPFWLLVNSKSAAVFLSALAVFGISFKVGMSYSLAFLLLGNNGIGESLKNSWDLAKKNLEQTVSYSLVVFIMQIIFAVILAIINPPWNELLANIFLPSNGVNLILFVLLSAGLLITMAIHALLPNSFWTSNYLELTTQKQRLKLTKKPSVEKTKKEKARRSAGE